MTGRTTRLILEALGVLSHGLNVVIVAHPAAEAFRIADEIAARAKDFGIPAELSDDNHDDSWDREVPVIMIRPFGWEPAASTYRRGNLTKVLVDHSAVFERTLVRPDAFRSVMA